MDDVSANPASGSEQDPVALIEGILEREENPPTKAADPSAKRSLVGEPKPAPGPEEDPAEPEQEETPADEEGEDDADDAEHQDEKAEAEPELYAVKVGGQEIQVTRDELVRGYQRLSDYTRKTQEVSAARQQVEAELRSLSSLRAELDRQLHPARQLH